MPSARTGCSRRLAALRTARRSWRRTPRGSTQRKRKAAEHSLAADRPGEAHRQQHDEQQRQHPPGRNPGGVQAPRAEEADHHSCGHHPVVADHEVIPERAERPQPRCQPAVRTSRLAHRTPCAARSALAPPAEPAFPPGERRSSQVRASPKSATAGMITSSAASEPGQDAPAPSPPQNTPKLVSMIPTTNFIVFSGTRASGARTANPTAATSTVAQPAAIDARPTFLALAPKVSTMKTTSSPSSSTPLNARVKPYQSGTPRNRRDAWLLASAMCSANSLSSSCRDLWPLARSTALRIHCSPKTRSSAPTTTRRAVIGIASTAGPRIATTTASTASADTVPVPADRQSRAVPAASTMVTASTASTAQARNTAINNALALALTASSVSDHRANVQHWHAKICHQSSWYV